MMGYPYIEIVVVIGLIGALVVAFLPEAQPLAVLDLG